MSRQSTFDKVDILGVSVDVLYLSEAITYICNYAGDQNKPAAYVVKPYVEFLDRAAGRTDLQELLNGAELSVADGVAVLWAAHYLYAGPRTFSRFWLTLAQIIVSPNSLRWPVPEKAAGTTFTWPLLHAAATANLKVFIVGKLTAEEIELVAHTINQAVPSLTIVGAASGRDTSQPAGQVSAEWIQHLGLQITEAKADIILVGMGFPLQEKVCSELAAKLPHGVFIGEGGTFDYDSFGGRRRKAPERVQKLGLEWLWRLLQEPSRFHRQLAIPRFIRRIWRSRH